MVRRERFAGNVGHKRAERNRQKVFIELLHRMEFAWDRLRPRPFVANFVALYRMIETPEELIATTSSTAPT